MNFQRAMACGAILFTCAAHSLGDNEKPRRSTGMVEVRFSNGSVVVMALQQDKIEIQTDYGALSVPCKDILQIEFGVRASDDDKRRIESAIKSLADASFHDREQAVKELVDLGPFSYRRLQHPSEFKDPEVRTRAESAANLIRERFHPRLLRTRDDDVVRAAKFTIVGRITTPAIKAVADDFGPLELRPAKLLVMRALGHESSSDVSVDAAVYGNPGGAKWMDSGVQVESHLGLRIEAAGRVDLWPQQPGQYVVGPDGQSGAPGNGVPNMARIIRGAGGGEGGGELLGRIGENGPTFLIGSRHTQSPKESGKLYLQIAPSPWGNPSTGEYKVKIVVGPFGDDAK